MLRFKLIFIISFLALLVAGVTFWVSANDDDDEKVTLSDIPAKVIEAANKAVPGGEITSVEIIYEVEKVVDGVEYEIEVTADGVVIDVEKEGDDDEDDKDSLESWNFNADTLEKVASGFHVAETNGKGKLATWQVVKDATTPNPPNVFALTSTDNNGSTYNLAIAKKTSYKDVDISVQVKAVSGEEDQGGGPIWRAKGKDNYYIARWNPLENNFRVYFVKNSKRKQLGSANVELQSDQWHTIRIVMVGQKIHAYLDGKKLITLEDNNFADAGMIGLWTKADAATSFDDLSVKPLQ